MTTLALLQSHHEELKGRVVRVESDVVGLRQDIDKKHEENRTVIHDLRNKMEQIALSIHALDVKFARASGYAVGAGAVVAVLLKVIDKVWK